jgi:DNA-binding PadR family transcriptional regulator
MMDTLETNGFVESIKTQNATFYKITNKGIEEYSQWIKKFLDFDWWKAIRYRQNILFHFHETQMRVDVLKHSYGWLSNQFIELVLHFISTDTDIALGQKTSRKE